MFSRCVRTVFSDRNSCQAISACCVRPLPDGAVPIGAREFGGAGPASLGVLVDSVQVGAQQFDQELVPFAEATFERISRQLSWNSTLEPSTPSRDRRARR
jgi:hypothetical protein